MKTYSLMHLTEVAVAVFVCVIEFTVKENLKAISKLIIHTIQSNEFK